MLGSVDSFFNLQLALPSLGTNRTPLLADLFLCFYEIEFLYKLIKDGKRKLDKKFSLSYRYIDYLISFKNRRFQDFYNT